MYLSDLFLAFLQKPHVWRRLWIYVGLGSSTEPPLDPPQISMCHIQYVVGGHCNFTHDYVPPSHQFIYNFA